MRNRAESIVYEFDKFRISAGKRLLWNGGDVPISLTPKVFDTLLYLVSNNGRVIDKDELMSAIWPDTVVEENNLNKNISVLRQALGENPREHRFIVTVPGKGYKFVAPVKAIAETGELLRPVAAAVDAAIVPPDPVTERDRVGSRRPRRVWLVTMAVFVLAGLILVGSFAIGENSVSPITSVAVLPFLNTDGDPELEYLSEGLSESLIDRLSELPQLKVIARSSSFKFRDENIDFGEVGRKLGVGAIITGKVTRRGDDLRIRVELIDARDNKHLWGEQFNRKAGDALAVQADIARMVSGKMRLKLSGEQDQQLAKRGTENPRAHDLLLKGDFFVRKAATRAKALEHYSEAVVLDPNYALAYARLAGTYQSLAGSSVLDPKDVLPKVQAAALRAIELDQNLAEAHHVLAELARDSWDWATAEREYELALELKPSLVSAHRRYSSYLSNMGRHGQAIAEAERVKELDPQQLLSHSGVALALLAARRFDESIVEIKKTLELDQFYVAYTFLGIAYAGKGMYGEAITAYKEAIRLGSKENYHMICLGAAYARAGEREKARAILKELETSKEYVSPGELPILYAALGEREKAFETLEKAYAAHDLQLQHLNADPGFDPLREDPRFQDLLRRVGLSE